MWGDESKPPLLLIHGGRDHARNWDAVAEAFVDDYCIYAPDLRGHGDSAWAIGGQYSMVDYTLDIAQLANVLDRDPLTIIGHSLGGGIGLQYAGTFPDRVKRAVAIEGLGPGVMPHRPAHQRMTEWI